VSDAGDGSYSVTCVVPLPGDYTTEVCIRTSLSQPRRGCQPTFGTAHPRSTPLPCPCNVAVCSRAPRSHCQHHSTLTLCSGVSQVYLNGHFSAASDTLTVAPSPTDPTRSLVRDLRSVTTAVAGEATRVHIVPRSVVGLPQPPEATPLDAWEVTLFPLAAVGSEGLGQLVEAPQSQPDGSVRFTYRAEKVLTLLSLSHCSLSLSPLSHTHTLSLLRLTQPARCVPVDLYAYLSHTRLSRTHRHSHTHCLSQSLPPSLPHCVSHCVSPTVSPSLSPSLCLSLCLFHGVSLTVSPTVSPSLSLSLCLSQSPTLSPSLCLPLCLTHSLSQSRTVSPSAARTVSPSLPLSPSRTCALASSRCSATGWASRWPGCRCAGRRSSWPCTRRRRTRLTRGCTCRTAPRWR
jgi:hypothetical protein